MQLGRSRRTDPGGVLKPLVRPYSECMESGGGAERSGGGGIFLSVKRNFGQVFVWGDATTVLIFSAARPYEERRGRNSRASNEACNLVSPSLRKKAGLKRVGDSPHLLIPLSITSFFCEVRYSGLVESDSIFEPRLEEKGSNRPPHSGRVNFPRGGTT